MCYCYSCQLMPGVIAKLLNARWDLKEQDKRAALDRTIVSREERVIPWSRYFKLVPGLAHLARPANVLQCDTRMLAHLPENTVLSIKSFRSIKLRDIAVVHYTYTIVRHDRA
jgi:hypothetical protein